MSLIAIMIGSVVLIGLVYILIYNGLVSKKNEVDNSFSGVDVQLKKRYDLIPNLISSVKVYMEHEKGLLEKITELRTKALKPNVSPDKMVKLDNEISQTMKGIMVAVENYPNLKASNNFVVLQQSMHEVEAQISAARRTYNACVTDYNKALEMFPSNMIATTMSYKHRELFVIENFERQNVNVGAAFRS